MKLLASQRHLEEILPKDLVESSPRELSRKWLSLKDLVQFELCSFYILHQYVPLTIRICPIYINSP
jgi:hypothetical protein